MKKLIFVLLCFCLMTLGSSAKIIEVAPAGAWGIGLIGGGGGECSWSTIWEASVQASVSEGDSQTAAQIRNIIMSSASTGSAETIRITFQARAAGANLSPECVKIGTQTSDDAWTGETEVTFSSGSGFDIAAGNTIVSDEITFSFSTDSTYLVELSNGSNNDGRSYEGLVTQKYYDYTTSGSCADAWASEGVSVTLVGIQKIEGCN